MEPIVTRLAVTQQGVVARRQLTASGMTGDAVDGLVRRGRLSRAARGVYLVAGAPRTPLTEPMVATLRAGSGARAVGERMLAAAGVRDARRDGHFVVLVPPARTVSAVDFAWRHDPWPDSGTTASVGGVPSWSVARNALEAAVDAADDCVRMLANGVRRLGRSHGSSMSRLALATPGHAGARRLVRLGCLDADAAESNQEIVLEHVLWDYSPERQVRLGPGLRVDLLLREVRVVVEYDGHADHASQADRLEDARRDARLGRLGYAVVRVTAADLRDPEGIRARVAAVAAVA